MQETFGALQNGINARALYFISSYCLRRDEMNLNGVLNEACVIVQA